MHTGIKLKGLSGCPVCWLRGPPIHDTIGKKTQGARDDVEKFGEGEVGKAHKTCQKVDIPEQPMESEPFHGGGNPLGYRGYSISHKCPLGPRVTACTAHLMELCALLKQPGVKGLPKLRGNRAKFLHPEGRQGLKALLSLLKARVVGDHLSVQGVRWDLGPLKQDP